MRETSSRGVRRGSPTIRLGILGADSSHLAEFTRRIAALHDRGATPCRVTAIWSDGQHDMPAEQVERWIADATACGATMHPELEPMLDAVDGVLVLSVNGNRHLEHARPSLHRGLPTYIDKPLACDLEQASEIVSLAERHQAPCYSASSLRFVEELAAIRQADLGDFVAIDAFGPGELHQLMPGVFYYGVHTIELVDAIWGRGVAEVSARHATERDLVQLRYRDGRHASLRLERAGAYGFGATIHGTKRTHSFVVDFARVYDRLVEAMMAFFERKLAPVNLRDTLENVAVMAAANRSMDEGGVWVAVPSV